MLREHISVIFFNDASSKLIRDLQLLEYAAQFDGDPIINGAGEEMFDSVLGDGSCKV